MMRISWLVIAALAAPGAQAAFRCVDEHGVTHFGDRPPAACAKVPVYEISRSGTVLRKIEPTPSPEELKKLLAEQARAKEEAKARDEQKRKDWALLSTYASERDFDMTRDHTIEPIHGRIKSAKDRIGAVNKRGKELEDELEFYQAGKSKTGKGKEPPAHLVADLERTKAERATLEKSIADYEKEIAQIRANFEKDKKRWASLKKGTLAPGTLTEPVSVPTAADAGAAKSPEKR